MLDGRQERKTVRMINKQCPLCGKVSSVSVDPDDYQRWKTGTLIQDAFPYLTPDQREILMTGIDAKCWDIMHRVYEDEDNGEN